MSESRGPNLRQALHRTARHHAHDEALADSQHRYTYQQMLTRVQQTAALLFGLGVRKGDRVALMMLPSTIHPIALYGCWELGAVPVALHVREKLPVLVKTIERISPRALIYDGAFAEQVAQIRAQVPLITGYVRARSEATPPEHLRSGDEPLIPDDLDRYRLDFEPMALAGHDLAAIVLTSGTTGIPKGVLHTHERLVDSCRAAVYPFGLTPHSSTLNMFTTSFMGWSNLALPYFNIGARQVFHDHWDPQRVLRTIAQERLTNLLLVPTMWRLLLREDVESHDLSSLRQVGFAGEVMDLPTLEAIRRRICPRIINCYSTTETAVSGGTAMAPDVFRLFHALGVPLRNIYGCSEFGLVAGHRGTRYDLETVGPLLDVDPAFGEPLQARIESSGELLLRGGTGFLGYWNKPDKTAALDRDGWFVSGDAVQRTSSGELVFLDRIEHLVKLANGHSYPPQFIETRLRFSPFIKDVMVLGDATRPWVGALINIDMGVAARWAEERRIAFSTFTDLSQRPEIRALVRDEIVRINALLPPASRVVRFANFPKELDADEGELTRTRKLRREFLEQRYKPLIDGLYAGAVEVDCSIAVTYQDGRQGALRAHVAVTDIEDRPAR
jgi:long-subunit acyl-CoA synthetase (AMP-forming)